MNRFRIAAITLCAMLATTAASLAVDVELSVSTPTNTMPRPVTVHIERPGLPPAAVPVMIPPGTTVMGKRNLIVGALNAAGFTAVARPEPNKAEITGLPAGSTVRMVDGGTGEIQDSIVVQDTVGELVGNVAFPAFFPPMNFQNQPAIFTAGIVTDVGELTAQVSASELNFQTDGPIICQALFQRLAPRAPQYGAQINYAGDRLEVYFDPAYTVTQGGITFGTTSQGQGAQGFVVIPNLPPPQVPGDMNCDGVVNALDIQPFVDAILMTPAEWNQSHIGCNRLNGDLNGDGAVDMLDHGPFIQALMH
ncbi:MAG: hypothetical protein HZA51_01695 [Planctomycetes bacterium]|nr:hypothetical protein [Planctomycetota bacterium]